MTYSFAPRDRLAQRRAEREARRDRGRVGAAGAVRVLRVDARGRELQQAVVVAAARRPRRLAGGRPSPARRAGPSPSARERRRACPRGSRSRVRGARPPPAGSASRPARAGTASARRRARRPGRAGGVRPSRPSRGRRPGWAGRRRATVRATASTIAAFASMPVLTAATGMSTATVSICSATIAGSSATQLVTATEFCAVTAVIADVPCTPCAAKVFRSAWMPGAAARVGAGDREGDLHADALPAAASCTARMRSSEAGEHPVGQPPDHDPVHLEARELERRLLVHVARRRLRARDRRAPAATASAGSSPPG